MTEDVLTGLYTFLFVVLAVLVTFDWLRLRERGHGVLSLSMIGLALATGIDEVTNAILPSTADLPGVVSVELTAIGLTAYFLFRFRETFVPSRRLTRVVMGAGVVLVVLDGVLLGFSSQGPDSPLALASEVLILVYWLGAVGDAIVRFWRLSTGRPPVQRVRLRALSVAYGTIIAFLLITVVGSAVPLESRWGEAIDTSSAFGITLIPLLLYAAFTPPKWLRRFWRRHEVELYRRGLEDLLLASTERSAMASRALDSALRLVGAEQAVMTDGNGFILADRAITTEQLTELRAAQQDGADGVIRLGPPGGLTAIVLPLRLTEGAGMLALVSGPFSPFFGADEVELLRQFAISITAALERVKLIEALEEASRAKSDFLSRMSHELRTPLNAILGFTQLLEFDELDGNQRDSVERIHRAGNHLLKLINEILDLTRIESGNIPVELQAVEVAAAVEEALALARPLAGSRDVKLDAYLGAKGLAVAADRQRMVQVLLNLLSNAIKYGPVGGVVNVTVEEVGAQVRVHVVDRGHGIPTDAMGRLFQPFDRLGAEGTEVDGTGIGLALSLALAKLMDGDIEVRSTVGAGSDFWLALPVTMADPAAVDVQRPAQVDAINTAGAILYVEDNASNIELVRRILERHGSPVRLDVAMLGGLGLDLARHGNYDLILLDAHLPDSSGLEVLTQLRQGEHTRAMPVVMVSADATPSRIEEALAGGAYRYLTKPINVKEFLGVVDEVLAAA